MPAASRAGVAAARAAARELGLRDGPVQFTPWLAYEARSAMYREADLAVICLDPRPAADRVSMAGRFGCLAEPAKQPMTPRRLIRRIGGSPQCRLR